jgi:serine protease Do
VIGVNVAVAQGAQNIGFAIPVDIVKDGLAQFESNGSFASKPFLGVEYQMISRQTALLNDVPQGAYITNVVSGTPAEKAGIEVDDIITKFDGQSLTEEGGLGEFISKKKVGDSVSLTIWRDGETKELKVTLGNSS